MGSEESNADFEKIHQIMTAFEEFDNTGDADVVAPHLAEDVVFMSPGSSPVQGKDEIVAQFLEPFPEDAYDIDQHSEDLLVDEELAVNRASVVGKRVSTDGEEEEVSHKGIDVFQKDSDGSWKIIISIWNDQA